MSESVSIRIDNCDIKVPKGINLIEAAKQAGIEIPHYCYHPDLSIVGNCRMCQVEIKGSPKLVIACNTFVAEGMEVFTHLTSEKVRETQESNLEFILKNHPLDCTVCDQSGHCKLQDYYFEYSRRGSRLLETKVKKKKAVRIGTHIMLDAERCILCTRCVRFLDEITGTGELGVVSRGDRSEIDLFPGKTVDNPLSATIIDLCPVGALTYADWRFNTRIWFTKSTESLCVGCSRNCNVIAHERDGEIVTVKARYNRKVNKEWLCDEGRFGFNRFKPQIPCSTDSNTHEALAAFASLVRHGEHLNIILSSFLTLEDILVFKSLSEAFPNVRLYGLVVRRQTSDLERILVMPDYSPNRVSFEKVGIPEWNGDASTNLCVVGLTSFENKFIQFDTIKFLFSGYGELRNMAEVFIPCKYVYEKNGHFINCDGYLQKFNALFASKNKAESELIIQVFPELDKIDPLAYLKENLSVPENLDVR
ncbi:MAG: 2Fe-2S iron-sulfur cluster-binding protein [Deltaproteobacteria bacterium]|nr:2Fe-2S iron-sulfur cluster-binding protein [Deltaproteobacteria bacterium]